MMPGPVHIEQLCRHHDIRDFDCDGDDDYFRLTLEGYMLAVDQERDPLVFAAVDGNRVVGYIALTDLVLERRSQILRSRRAPRRHFLVSAFAISLEYQQELNVAARLVIKAREILRLRVDRRGPGAYASVVCIPHTNQAIHALLDRLGFQPMLENSFFWEASIDQFLHHGAIPDGDLDDQDV
jgi:ribosomal protein S18 acetylase RimI-like enzyme